MNKNCFIRFSVSSPLQWFRIYCLYRRSFPRNERKPFSVIRAMWKKGKTDVWYFENNGRFAGFVSTINDEDIILLDYLAVPASMRGKGNGTRILQQMKKCYSKKGLFVEIESVYESTPDRDERIRRKQFYMTNNMQPSRVMASVFGVNMELLCWNCIVDFPRYRAFYYDNYSPWAARNIVEAEYPE